jgi:hypothetical protein
MHQSARLMEGAFIEGLLQGVERQIAAQRTRRPPADDPPREHVDDEGHVHEPAPGGHAGQVRDPQLVRTRRRELARDEAWGLRPRGLRRDSRSDERPAPHGAGKPQPSHQPGHGAAGDAVVFPLQLLPDLRIP